MVVTVKLPHVFFYKIPYASEVRSLMYAMVCTKPDIGYVVGVVSWFMSNPGRQHV